MSFVVIGLGSMGRRRVRLLKQISEDFIIIGVDSREDRRAKAEEEFGIVTAGSLDDAFGQENFDCAVVSTSPLSHAALIEECLKRGCHVFTELNLVKDKYGSNMKLAEDSGKVLFLSSTFLYRDEIKYIKNRVAQSERSVSYSYHVGQYLPDWHPWEKVSDYFISDARTNGCRELFAIELPWIIKTFGPISTFSVLSGKSTDLPINYNDSYCLIIGHENGNRGMLAVDVVSRKAARKLEIVGENIYLTWDGTPAGLSEYDIEKKETVSVDLYETVDKQSGYAPFVIENAYRNELETFISTIKGEGAAEYSFAEDGKVLGMIDRIEAGQNL